MSVLLVLLLETPERSDGLEVLFLELLNSSYSLCY